MLNLPKSTEFNKRIPKQKFYENLSVTPALKKSFTEQVRMIWWRNKIAVSTANLAPGKTVTELEVLEIRLNQPSLDESVLLQIDREIPYHIFSCWSMEGSTRHGSAIRRPPPAVLCFRSANTITHSGWMLNCSPQNRGPFHGYGIRELCPTDCRREPCVRRG